MTFTSVVENYTGFNPSINTLYLDCDGVLADFDERAYQILGMNPRRYELINGSDAFWSKLNQNGDFFMSLDLMYDAETLYRAVKHLDPVILTGVPKEIPDGSAQKVQWAGIKFGREQKIITCPSKDKRKFCKPGDIIIDDWPKHRHLWEEAGGIWIDHRGADWTIGILKGIGVI